MDFAQMTTLLKQLTDAVEKLEKSSTQMVNNEIDERIILLAKQYPIKGHYLVDKTDNVRKLYIGLLLAFCNTISNRELEDQKKYYICRIIASFDRSVNLKTYIVQSLKLDVDTISHLTEDLDTEAAVCFAVDLLILIMGDGKGGSKREYEVISDILQFLQMSRQDVNKIATIAKTIIEQDFEQFVKNINPADTMNCNYFLGYFPDVTYTVIAKDISNLQYHPGKVLVVNVQISNYQEYIELNDCIAESITFKNCSFFNIRGFRTNKQKVVFDGCSFEKNYLDLGKKTYCNSSLLEVADYRDIEKDYVFIQGNEIQMKNTMFTNVCASKSILDITEGEIDECKFINCCGIELPCSYLFQLSSGKITNSIFNNCTMFTTRKWDIGMDLEFELRRTGGILSITNGFIGNCTFDECTAEGKANSSAYNIDMQIVKAECTKVENNIFNKCCCSSEYTSSVHSYILGIRNTSENNNRFIDCSSDRYIWGRKQPACDIGEIE